MTMMPRAWRSWCGPTGTARSGSKAAAGALADRRADTDAGHRDRAVQPDPRPDEDLRPGRAQRSRQGLRVRLLLEDEAAVAAIVVPLLDSWRAVRTQAADLDRQLLSVVRENAD